MINFARTADMQRVKQILTTPECWFRMVDDAAPDRDKFECLDRGHCLPILAYLNDAVVGVFLLVSSFPGYSEVHFCLLPSVWGNSESIGKAFVEWVWKETSIVELTGPVPAHNRLCLRLAIDCGFTLDEIRPQMVSKNGKAYDLMVMRLRRP